MSFGGSVQGMITSLKNNKTSRKRNYFDKSESERYFLKKKRTNFKKATPEQLKSIRKKLKKENRKTFYLRLILIIIFGILSIYLLRF